MAWAVGQEKADLIIEYMMRSSPEDYGPGGGSSLMAVTRIAELGTMIDGGGQYQVEVAQCHVDAEAAYMAARAALDATDLSLVRDSARTSTRPNWCPFQVIEVVPEYIVTNDRRLRARVRRPGGTGAYCPVRFVDRGNELMAWRAVYQRWYHALLLVEEALIGAPLTKWKLVPLKVPARPWEPL